MRESTRARSDAQRITCFCSSSASSSTAADDCTQSRSHMCSHSSGLSERSKWSSVSVAPAFAAPLSAAIEYVTSSA